MRFFIFLNFLVVTALMIVGSPASANSVHKKVATNYQAPAGRSLAAVAGSNRALEVRGQSRNLSMMLVLKNGKDNINFIKPRENFNSEILSTQF